MDEARVREILKETAPTTDWDKVGADDNLEDAGLDSLDKANVIMAIETDTGKTVDDARFDQLNTINEMAAI